MTFRMMRVRSPLCVLALSIAFFFLCDLLIFRSNFYPRFLTENSVGTLAYRVDRERHRTRPPGTKSLLLVGNSQVERGFSPTQFDRDFPNSGIHIMRADASKTYEEVWFYELKHIDPNHDKYSAILITLPDYKIEPFGGFGSIENYTVATLLAPFVSPSDWIDIIGRFKGMRLRVAELALFASHRYSFDLQDLFLDWELRMRVYQYKMTSGDAFDGEPPVVPGAWKDLTIQGDKVVNCVAPYNHFDCDDLEYTLRPVPKDEGQAITEINVAYERKWLGKIIDLYKGSKTQLIFVQMPRSPVPLPRRTPIAGAPDVRDFFAGIPNVTFVDENLMKKFETPEYMHDHAHVSMAAGPEFTKTLGAEIVKIMAGIPPS